MESVKFAKRVHDISQMDDDEVSTRRNRPCSVKSGTASIADLAHSIVQGRKVVILSGPGFSVEPDVRYGKNFIEETGNKKTKAETKPTPPGPPRRHHHYHHHHHHHHHREDDAFVLAGRQSFLKDPLSWYNSFWIPKFAGGSTEYKPHAGHLALRVMQSKYPNVLQITQNIDGLQYSGNSDDCEESSGLVEAHGRIGVFKCVPSPDNEEEDRERSGKDALSADEDPASQLQETDDDDSRPVKLGLRRKSNAQLIRLRRPDTCPYRYLQSLHISQLEPDSVRDAMVEAYKKHTEGNPVRIREEPRCPACDSLVMPQALFFDEEYHSHAFYQFERMEDALAECDIIVFVGACIDLRPANCALEQAKARRLPIYNFSPYDHGQLESTEQLNVINVKGPISVTIAKLEAACQFFERGGYIYHAD